MIYQIIISQITKRYQDYGKALDELGREQKKWGL